MQSFAAFFRENYSLVLGVADRRLSCRHDAEEVAADAFRIAWEHHQSGGELSVPWLYVTVRNLVGNEYRRRDRRRALSEKVADELRLHPARDEAFYSDVRDALDRLAPPYREILIVTYWDQLTSHEAAGVLGLSAAAVRARLMRARRMLRAALSEQRDPTAASTLPGSSTVFGGEELTHG